MTITALRPTLTPALDAVSLGAASGLEKASAASWNLRCVRTPHVVSLYGQQSAWTAGAHRGMLRQPAPLQRAA